MSVGNIVLGQKSIKQSHNKNILGQMNIILHVKISTKQ